MKNKKASSIVMAIALGTFMSSLDSSVVNLCVPLIKKDFGISISMVEWVVTAYLLVVSSLLLTYGRLSDLYGHKKVYSTGFVFFILGSMFCGFSINIVLLIMGRVIQALGAGMLFATGPAIITNAVPPERRGKALSITAMAVALGLCVGPVIGGTLSSLFGWQSIFFINLSIGIIAMIMVRKNVPKDEKREAVPFDTIGSVMIFFAVLCILLPLSISGDYSLPTALFLILMGTGVVIFVAFIFVESKIKFPMLNLSLFKNRVFTASNFAAFFAYMAQFIMVFLAPFYLEKLRMLSALTSGLLFLPMPLATMFMAPISGSFSDRFDSRLLSSAGNLIMAGGLFMLSFFNKNTSYLFIILSMIVTGIGFGLFHTPNNSAVMGNVPPQYRGIASGTLAMMRNIGMAVGVALSGALFSAFQKSAIVDYKAKGQSGAILTDHAFIYAMHLTFLAAVMIALLAMIASLTKGKVR